MPNDLTGDFDVVAEFTVPAVNRVLAAMHSRERFLHSLTLRVDDNPPPGSRFDTPAVVGVIDAVGDPVSDHERIRTAMPQPHFPSPSTPATAVDSVVNAHVEGMNIAPLTPSHLKGRAQVQVGPPSIELSTSETSFTASLDMMCRYFPDPGTAPAAEFVRGKLQITAALTQTESHLGGVLGLDIGAVNTQISFTPAWSSTPLSAEDRTGIDLLLRNALRTSFQPSNIPVSSRIEHARVKALLTGQKAIALMVDLKPPATDSADDSGAGSDPLGVLHDHLLDDLVIASPADPGGNPASVQNIFLGSGDDFAFAVGSDFIRAAFKPTVDAIRAKPIEPLRIPFNAVVHTWIVVYAVTLLDVTLDLVPGAIVLTMKGRATTSSWTPNFDFTIRQRFSLAVDGDTAELDVGELSFDPSSISVSVAAWLIEKFTGRITTALREIRDSALSESRARSTVREMLSAKENLGGFLTSLLTPAQGPVRDHRQPQLAYTAAEIRTSGIVLHGSLAMPSATPPRAEYEPVPSSGQLGPHGIGGAIVELHDYSALKSWIPGGTIQRYEWKSESQAGPGFIDENRFIFTRGTLGGSVGGTIADSANIVSGYSPLCVTISGMRLSFEGPIVDEAVTATVCGYRPFGLVSGFDAATDDLTVALSRRGSNGMVEVAGHAPAKRDETGARSPNLVVHFTDGSSETDPSVLTSAVAESGRTDAPTAVVVVTSPDNLKRTRYAPGVTYAEDTNGSWRQRYAVSGARGPVTLIVDPKGNVAWKQEGPVTRSLTEALGKHLVAQSGVDAGMLPTAVRIGQMPPNFLFDAGGGTELTLRKVAGRPVTLLFWRSGSRPSIEAVRDAVERARSRNGLVLAINDGESGEAARKAADKEKLSARIVADPQRQIALAYGVTVWPTTIGIDAAGVVRSMDFGRNQRDDRENSANQSKRSQGRIGE